MAKTPPQPPGTVTREALLNRIRELEDQLRQLRQLVEQLPG
jgi:hypothetical protein